MFRINGLYCTTKRVRKERFSINSYREISPQDLTCHCKTVRLGGKIINTTVLANQTKIEVLSLPVSSISAKPFVELQSDGRFIVYFNGFVEPENLKERYITVGGQLAGTEKGKIEQADYTYPVVQADKYRIWTLSTTYDYPTDDWDEDDWGF